MVTTLIVSVTGEIDQETFVMDVLADIIKEEVENQFDHKNLNLDVSEFENLNPLPKILQHLE
jgi:6-pyruvoyltetrahydropterin/6-carboxytetrahydropterin synthase